ncbi:MAG: glycosyltransferase family 2 protein [Flavobacteriales bacterium]|nr:glycosyltransferase family 2 protein [Flavobacteriales bacterium]
MSVVVVTYQHADYIERCIEGILMQETNFRIEVLLGEDESTDGTREICQRLAAAHPDRIRLFLRSRKDVMYIMGRPTGRANMLFLLDQAKGRYIAFCEGDDYWTDPLKLQKQVDCLEANADAVLCFHRVLVKRRKAGAADYLLPNKVEKSEFTTEDLIGRYYTHTSSLLYRRLPGFELPAWFQYTMSGDIPLLLLLSLEGKFIFLDDVMSVWRQHNASVSSGHTGYYRIRGHTYMLELFNAHTAFRFNDLIEKAFIKELEQLPEFIELRTLQKAKQSTFPRLLHPFRAMLHRVQRLMNFM